MTATEETKRVCVIEQALDDQFLRLDIGGDIYRRRCTLKLEASTLAKMLGCSESSITNMEQGLTFKGMPKLRMECLIVIDRLEQRQEGRRNGDLKHGRLSLVSR